eukprot:SAG11_NODE_619_length_8173_cov_4.837255_5_plen_163_part_00
MTCTNRCSIIAGLQRVNADIVCLQELQSGARGTPFDHKSQIVNQMAALGYEHLYCRNAGVDGQPLSPQGRPTLGNAIFYKPAVFRCEKIERVSYAQKISDICPKKFRQHFTNRKEQVALILALRHLKTGKRVVTATTHITADFTHKETQLAQVHQPDQFRIH